MKNTLITTAAASVFALLLPSAQPAEAGGGSNMGESGVVHMPTGAWAHEPAANDQLSGTEPPQTPPEIITHEHPSGISVAGVYLVVPNAECGYFIEDALRQNREVYVADEYCRKIMRQALEIQRNAPPVESQQAIGGETPPPPEVPAQPPAPATSVPNTPGFLKQMPNSQ